MLRPHCPRSILAFSFALMIACGHDPNDEAQGDGTGESTTGFATLDEDGADPTTEADATLDADGTTGDAMEDAMNDGTTGASESSTGESTGTSSPIDPDGALFVRDDGQDSNPGTPDEPLRTIQWAIGQAELSPDVDRIYVAEGSYTTDFVGNDRIEVSDGVALYGGYAADWSERDPLTFVTEVRDVGPIAQDYWVVFVPPDAGPDTVVDGLTIVLDPVDEDHQLGIVAQGEVQVTGNRIVGASRWDEGRAYGIVVEGGSPTIRGNRIDLSARTASGITVGATPFNVIPDLGTTGADVFNNVVHVQTTGDTPQAIGIAIADADGMVAHNSIHADDNRALVIGGTLSAATVHNNILSGAICVGYTSGFVGVITSNAFSCPTAMQRNSQFGDTLLELEALFPGSTDNIAIEDVFDAAPSLELDVEDVCAVTRGGTSVAEVDDDVAGLPRTEPVSLGAFEYDGPCQ